MCAHTCTCKLRQEMMDLCTWKTFTISKKKKWPVLTLKRSINTMVCLRLPMLIETLRTEYCTNIKVKSKTQPCKEKFYRFSLQKNPSWTKQSTATTLAMCWIPQEFCSQSGLPRPATYSYFLLSLLRSHRQQIMLSMQCTSGNNSKSLSFILKWINKQRNQSKKPRNHSFL